MWFDEGPALGNLHVALGASDAARYSDAIVASNSPPEPPSSTVAGANSRRFAPKYPGWTLAGARQSPGSASRQEAYAT